MEDLDRYLFDLRGYAVIPDALTPETVAQLNAEIDQMDCWNELEAMDIEWNETPWWQEREHERLHWIFPRDRNHVQLGPAFRWGSSWSDIMRSHEVVDTCSTTLGPDFYVDHASLVLARAGGRGFDLHGGQVPYLRHQYYAYREGGFDVGMMAIVVSLTPQTKQSGGLAIAPGSHKSSLAPPRKVRDNEVGDAPWIDKLDLAPGTAVVFPEATAHAVLPWAADWERRALLLKLYPAHLRSVGAPLRSTDEPFWATACKDDMPWHPMRVGSGQPVVES